MIKTAYIDDVTSVARRMRPHDRAERLALTYGTDPVEAAVRFLALPHTAVTVWRGDQPEAVIGAVYPHPGVASTIFFATDEFPRVALATTRWVRRTLIPLLAKTGIHRMQVCSMDDLDNPTSHDWIKSFGHRQEAFLYQYGRNGENFRLYTLVLRHVTTVEN